MLQAVLKWGEHELMRRMEDREPNLLSHTAHSVTRKGIKKRDLSDIELREILSELLPLVRMDHVLPPTSEHLNQAIRRGLVSTPPSHMIGDDRDNLRINAWVRCGKNHGLFVRPRLFMPYYEEIKSLLEDRCVAANAAAASHQMDVLRMRGRNRHNMPDIPDTLYMVSRLGTTGGAGANGGNGGGGSSAGGIGGLSNGLDIVAAVALPAPDPGTMMSMSKREQKLRRSPSCQRALSLALSARPEINRQIRLRVVREFNLPDAVADLLENASCYCLDDGGAVSAVAADQPQPPTVQVTPSICGGSTHSTIHSRHSGNDVLDMMMQQQLQQEPMDDESTPPPSPAIPSECGVTAQNLSTCYGRNMTLPRQQPLPLFGQGGGGVGMLNGMRMSVGGGGHHLHQLPSLISERDAIYRMDGPETSSCSDGHLSDIMPDVAMATASMGQLQLTGGGGGGGESVYGSRDLLREMRGVDGMGHLQGLVADPTESLQLDLGDGSSHMMMGLGSGASGGLNIQHHRGLQVSSSINKLNKNIKPYNNL